MLLDSVRELAREQIAPRAEHYDRTCRVPLGARAGDQRAGPERHVHPGGLRRCAHVVHRLPGLRARDQPGLRRHGHHLGHQLPRHEAPDRLGHRGAEAASACRASRRAVSAHWRSPSPAPAPMRPACGRRFARRATRSSSTAARPSSPTATWRTSTCCSASGRASPDAKESISVLILEKGTPGLSVVRLEDKMGTRASSTATHRLRQLPRAARQPARASRATG